ncbi:MAG: hypothetical protein KJ970_15305 [Candidatus Eisenbacteria bacterium]|uniref:Polysaccharide chain length determinant N-terminal domain-containing protein n=1 Tax=Eiseniibacteriota bacterium TaxID=2212470 RepID=A0A948W773_UNCEI|nr:hypothetical protein [Candidatus Eisenbacteria bacterium]MBU1948700.1 hypothetical protein [Candidatus Eisenbacteria bacterium]MBU2692289.1 hypothetical protein [Candidatus Eisenbacteria bacterium]
MNETGMPTDATSPTRPRSSLIHLAEILFRWRKFILIFTACTILFAIVISFAVSPVYQAETVIYPQADPATMLMGGESSSQLQSLLGFPGAGTGSELLQAVLNSRNLTKSVLEVLGKIPRDPDNALERREVEEAIDEQLQRIDINVLQTGAVRIRFSAPDAGTAARTANLYVSHADSLLRLIGRSHAGSIRQFLEQRMDETQEELHAAQDRLLEFQTKNNAVNLDAQTEATMRVLSELQTETLKLEAEIDMKRRFYADDAMEIRALEAHRNALRERITKLTGPADSKDSMESSEVGGTPMVIDPAGSTGILLNTQSIPGLSARFARLLLDAEVQKEVLVFLNGKVEQAKLDEARSVPTIQVIDRAMPPSWKIKPRRKLIVFAGVVLGFLGACILAVLLQSSSDSLSQEDRSVLSSIRRQLPFGGKNPTRS